MVAKEFQSTPAIADGRTRRRARPCRCSRGFNPRPPSLTGEPIKAECQAALDAEFQSTPAIADGRTLLPGIGKLTPVKFQSTPAIADGRT